MNKDRYNESFEDLTELLLPSEKEDKVTREFYKDLSQLSKQLSENKTQKTNLIQQILKILNHNIR